MDRSSSLAKIQIALDLLDRELLREIALYAYESGVDIIEIGTPAIKRYGVEIIREVRELLGDRAFILADMKTSDVAEIEIGLAAEAGANATTIMGVAYDEVILEAVNAKKKFNIEVWADLMYIDNYLERSLKLRDLGIDTVILHIGIDVQRRRGVTAEILREEVFRISREGLRVAVAGGLDPVKARELIARGASIVIIGGWVTRHRDWRDRIRECVRVIKSGNR
ncbi:MAG: orotidine 5'-phosphate decarboxylase / HUMPS family protein [Sulfolobales archaeon]